MEWIETTIGEYCPFSYGKALPQTKRVKGNYPVYGSNGIVGYHKTPSVQSHGVIIGRKGSLGAIHLSLTPFWAIDTSFYVIKESILELKFTYFLLQTLGLHEMNSDSAVPGLNRDNAHSVRIRIPKLQSDREKIGEYLSIFDNKIALNTQTNQTLEAIAQAIFKHWFIDFAPVHAKAEVLAAGGSAEDAELAAMASLSGKTLDAITALAQSDPDAYQTLRQTAQAFPSAFTNSELGLVPEGWDGFTIKDCCKKLYNGGTPKRKIDSYWNNGTIPWLSSGEVCNNNILIQSKEFITKEGLSQSAAKIVPINSTLVAIYASPTAGKCSFCAFETTTNQAVCSLVPIDNFQYFNYLNLKTKELYFANRAVGSAQQNISKQIIEDTPSLKPNDEVMLYFNTLLEPIFKKLISNLNENLLLSMARDTLLPKLLNGEIEL
ncbi:restriction endonuclease subunit S [Avibacterium sp. 21-595]|uniref:restriction endonuclease subunit S n=1 Tax=Avibacterium sp. 21-595 TaxID=2911527 RepID=UPI002026A2B4|nr:restriction endonuclease subunit S [Avibacterium sp. 21-595]URL07264.1 restriction endonuclease subunit S [Avibacterium sp. 21-595]